MKRTVLSILFLVLMPWMTAFAENRFPKPQFESGYAMPSATTPVPRTASVEVLDIVVLAAALSLSAWLVLKTRSRRGVFLLSVFSLIYFGFWRKGCICPVGSIQNVVLWLCDSHVALPLGVAAFFILPLVFALLFGRVFCASVCPLGAIQEMMVLFPVRLPSAVSLALGMVPVVYLGLAVLFAATGSAFVVCRLDPFVSLFRLSGEWAMVTTGIVLLLVGTVIARPYCRFFCPFGVLLNGMSKLSKWHATVTPNECVQCRLCERACPFDAIRFPNGTVTPESRERGMRRVKWVLVAIPALIAAGIVAGAYTDGVLSRMNPTVRLAGVLQSRSPIEERNMSVELEAFRSSGAKPEDVIAQAGLVRHQFRVGGRWLGGSLGAIFGFCLLNLSIRRSRGSYEPDRGECLSCARCYMSCPKEHERLGISELFVEAAPPPLSSGEPRREA